MPNILVTGASRGIGRAIAQSLADRGARLALHYRADAAGAERTRKSLQGAGHIAVTGELSNAADVERLWREVTRELGDIDVLINNAGIYSNHPPLTTDFAAWEAAWTATLGTNLLGAAHLSYFAAHAMAGRGAGRIVSISSRGAFRGEPTAPAYAASKAGLNAFSQSLAKALAPRGVFVFVVAPGWVETERVAESIRNPAVIADQPLGRVATPEEIAQVATFCALDAPGSLTGAILDVNGASYLRT